MIISVYSLTTCSLVLILLGLLWYRGQQKYCTHFKRLNVPALNPIFPIGNMFGVLLRTQSAYDFMLNTYNHFADNSFFGIYHSWRPVLCVRDPKLVQRIILQDFDHFVDHQPLLADPSIEPLIGRSLLSLRADKWRDMRTTLNTAFTACRVAAMFPLVAELSLQAMDNVRRKASTGPQSTTKLRDVQSRYITDVQALMIFGIKANSSDRASDHFYRLAQKAFAITPWTRVIKIIFASVLFKLSAPFRIRYFSDDIVDYFSSLVLNTIDYRIDNNIEKPDIIQTLLNAQQRFQHDDDGGTSVPHMCSSMAAHAEMGSDDFRGVRRRQWDNEEIVSQCFMLLWIGYSITKVTLSFVIYELMMSDLVQARLRAEIDAVRASSRGRQLQYNDVDKMKYLDMVISETLRKWPSSLRLERVCVKEYELTDDRGRSVKLQAGDAVWMPILGMHMDPKYFPDPHTFDPDRFGDDRKHLIKPFTYLPFGAGPRNCIGFRFAMMQMKVFIFHLLSAYTLSKPPKPCLVPIKKLFVIRIEDFDIQLRSRSEAKVCSA